MFEQNVIVAIQSTPDRRGDAAFAHMARFAQHPPPGGAPHTGAMVASPAA
jgi:hypothetical protein